MLLKRLKIISAGREMRSIKRIFPLFLLILGIHVIFKVLLSQSNDQLVIKNQKEPNSLNSPVPIQSDFASTSNKTFSNVTVENKYQGNENISIKEAIDSQKHLNDKDNGSQKNKLEKFEEEQDFLSEVIFWKKFYELHPFLKRKPPITTDNKFLKEREIKSIQDLDSTDIKLSYDFFFDTVNNLSKGGIKLSDFTTLKVASKLFSQFHSLKMMQPAVYSKLLNSKIFSKSEEFNDTLFKLEKHLFSSWLKNNVTELYRNYRGRGIVLTTGSWHFHMATLAIISVRKVLGSQLPIEVFYIGEYDLTKHQLQILSSFENVKVVNILPLLNMIPEGWAVKPFAILLSSFAEVIFMDADVLFMKDPVILFDSDAYKSSGTLYFRDRSMDFGEQKSHLFVRQILPKFSLIFENSRFYHQKTYHEMESGVVVINKRSTALYALLTVCQLNNGKLRDTMYKSVHGDKETFWIAHELVNIPYSVNGYYGGVIGFRENIQKKPHVCGGLLHAGEDGQPLWWNGGLAKNKRKNQSDFMELSDYALDTINFTGKNSDGILEFKWPDGAAANWVWETDSRPFCLEVMKPWTTSANLNKEHADIGKSFLKIAKFIDAEGMKNNNWTKVLEFSP